MSQYERSEAISRETERVNETRARISVLVADAILDRGRGRQLNDLLTSASVLMADSPTDGDVFTANFIVTSVQSRTPGMTDVETGVDVKHAPAISTVIRRSSRRYNDAMLAERFALTWRLWKDCRWSVPDRRVSDDVVSSVAEYLAGASESIALLVADHYTTDPIAEADAEERALDALSSARAIIALVRDN